LTKLVAALVSNGLVDTVNNDTLQWTIFAPNDDAFAGVDTSAASPELTNTLLGHVVPSYYGSGDLLAASTPLVAANGDNLVAYEINGTTYVNGAAITAFDVPSLNAVVHIVSKILGPDIVDAVRDQAQLSSVVDVLDSPAFSGYAATKALLETAGPFTLFAPNNASFAGVDFTNNDISGILQYHATADGGFLSTDIAPGVTFLTSAVNSPIKVNKTAAGAIMVNNASVVLAEADIVGFNGVVHTVDAVLALPAMSTSELATDAGLTKLVAALVSNGLVDTVNSNTSQWTIFAPNDDAFMGVDTAASPELNNTLLRHVVPGYYGSGDLLASTPLVAANGDNLVVSETDGSTYVNGAEITTFDVPSLNAVVHIVNKILDAPAPPAKTNGCVKSSSSSAVFILALFLCF